jgi:U4/U6.U5 tri-snRNP-associated protein 1
VDNTDWLIEQEPTTEAPVVGNGLAGVLTLLRQSGSLQKRSSEDAEREKVQKQKDLWLADYRARMAKRELERIQARGGNKDQAQREWENKMREQNEARDALEMYKNYKPDFEIKYHDEFGRAMTPKEAWKSLSHKFQYVSVSFFSFPLRLFY